jgi:hydrogenase-1 operon protein HyaF
MKPFPIPVVPFGPGSQSDEGELDYMTMPQAMFTYSAPRLPEPEDMAQLTAAHGVLRAVLDALDAAQAGSMSAPISLAGIDAANLALVNQVLGEGEVSARIGGAGQVLIQEAVFAGVWRCVRKDGERVVSDEISVGPIPDGLIAAARAGAGGKNNVVIPSPLPAGVMNAPSVLAELSEHVAEWREGAPTHVINLSLLPLSPQDSAILDAQIGNGSVLILSRGYGNCRITSTWVPNCWQVVYYNSQDEIILNTIEIVDIPEVACAAHEDLADSRERLAEVLQWAEAA